MSRDRPRPVGLGKKKWEWTKFTLLDDFFPAFFFFPGTEAELKSGLRSTENLCCHSGI